MKKSNKSLFLRATPLFAAVAALVGQPASAVTWWHWNGTANWNTAANPPWTEATVPSGAGAGALIQTGTATIDSATPTVSSILLGWNSATACAINMTGGSLTVTGTNPNGADALNVGWDHTGTFTQSGGTVTAAVVGMGSTGTYNLNGGTLATPKLFNRGGAPTFNLNGGTLQATASDAAWFNAGMAVNVQAGGALIDTQGYDVGVGSALLNSGGGLTKNGTGSLTLTGANTYTNLTTVNAGTLIYNVSAANLNINAIAGAGNVTFQGNPGGFYSLISPLSNAGTTTVSLTTGSAAWNGTIFVQRPGTGGAGSFSASSVLNVVSGKVDQRNNQTVAGLVGSGGYITTDASGLGSVLTVNTAPGQSYTYSGVVGATPDAYNYPNVGITKTGAGTQILSGTNTYTGATTVNGGTLLVHGSLGAGSAVTVNNSGTLGGTGTVGGSVTVAAGGTLAPGETNSVGTLTVSNLVMVSGAVYPWECNTVTSDLVCVLGTVTLPAAATINLSALDGASMPSQGVLFTYGVTNAGATDLGGWTVSGSAPGTVFSFTDDAANRQVLFTISAATEADGVWNKAGALTVPVPDYAWNNTGNWISGIVADGTNRTAHFDAVDSTTQTINLGSDTRTIGHPSFNDTVPSTYGFWSLHRGTLNLRTTSGSPTILVSNTNMDAGVESDVTLTGDFTKMGPGAFWLKNIPSNVINITEGKIVFYRNVNTRFENLSLSGGGDVEFVGQAAGFFDFISSFFKGALTYTGHTRVNLSAATWPSGVLFLQIDDVLPHATVLDVLSGKIYLRNQTTKGLNVAGLTGYAGTVVTTDYALLHKLTLDVADGVSCAYAGTIGHDSAYAGSTGNLTLTKKGLGTQILSGANTFIGTLAVSNGTLLANNTTGSGTGTNNSVTVAAGATLGGTGTLLSTNVTFASGAVLAPGGTNGLGTLTFGGNVALADGAVYLANVKDTGSNTVAVAGAITLPATASVSLSVVGVPLPEQITLFTAGSLVGATDLRGWQVSGVGTRRYLVSREGTSVVATLLPQGTLIRVF